MDYLSAFNKFLILNYVGFIFILGWVLFNWLIAQLRVIDRWRRWKVILK